MPNRGTLNWNSSNTTYSVQPGYYSGGTLDSRTSYTNGYNSGYNKGKEEGGGEIDIGGSKYTSSMINMPGGEIKMNLDYSSVQNYNETKYSDIVRIPLPKSNPSKVIINTFCPKYPLNVSTSEHTSSSGSSKDCSFNNEGAFIQIYSKGGSTGSSFSMSGSGLYLTSIQLNTSTSWKTYETVSGYSSCTVSLEYRVNGKFLEFRIKQIVKYVAPTTLYYYTYNGSIKVSLGKTVKQYTDAYGRPQTSVVGEDRLASISCY